LQSKYNNYFSSFITKLIKLSHSKWFNNQF
jgi:hypothetical protein